jgi:hypothetical protein
MSYDNLSCVSWNLLKFYQLFTGEERRIPFIFDDFHFCRSRVIGLDMTENRIFICPSRDGAVLCDWVWRAGVHTGFPHNNFSSVYRIFTKLGHMIPLWKGKNPIFLGVIRSKVKVIITINRIFDNMVVST